MRISVGRSRAFTPFADAMSTVHAGRAVLAVNTLLHILLAKTRWAFALQHDFAFAGGTMLS